MASIRKQGGRWRVGRSPVKFKSRQAAARFAGNIGKPRRRRKRKGR